MENVVAKHQRNRILSDEFPADEKRLGDAIRRLLHCVGKANAPLPAVAEKLLEFRQVLWRRDEQDVFYVCQHQRRQRVVHHRLVVDRQQLLGYGERGRVQARARTARQDDSLHAMLPCSTRRRSASTIMAMSCSRLVFGAQPSRSFALAGLPSTASISARRNSAGSTSTCFS